MLKSKKAVMWALALAVIAAVGMPARAAAPAIIKQIPDTAPGFLVVSNLSEASKKIALLDEQLGLANPMMQNALAFAKTSMNMVQGINDNGSLVVVVPSMPADPGAEPPVIMLIPVTNYGAFLKNFGVDGGAGVSPIQLQGEPGFAKQLGAYAVVGNQQDTVASFQLQNNQFSERAGVLGNKVMTDSDVTIYLDYTKLGPMLQPMVMMSMMQLQEQMKNQPAGTPGEKLGQAFMGIWSEVVNAFMRDAQAMVIGLDIDENGIGLSGSAQFKAGSPLAATFGKSPTKPIQLDRLPSRPYLMASAIDMSTLPVAEWAKAVAAKMPDDAFGTMMKNSLKVFELNTGQTQQAYYAPGAGAAPGASLFNSVSVFTTDNPKAAVKAQRQIIVDMAKLELMPGMKYLTSYEEDVMQVEGKQVDQYSMRMQIPPDQMAQLGPAAMFLGQDMGGYMVATDKAVIMTSGADPKLIKEAIGVADGGGKLGADAGIQAVQNELHPHRVSEAYISVDNLTKMVGGFAALFMPGVNFSMPADTPPIATSVSVHNGGMSVREYVPMKVIVGVNKMIQGIMQQQGGPGGAAPPLSFNAN
ncbi:MAG: hypothetical protein GC159_04905 [Phycisphaera sp.]|nr:hypothetical protein [Phycisphaera sp.]